MLIIFFYSEIEEKEEYVNAELLNTLLENINIWSII